MLLLLPLLLLLTDQWKQSRQRQQTHCVWAKCCSSAGCAFGSLPIPVRFSQLIINESHIELLPSVYISFVALSLIVTVYVIISVHLSCLKLSSAATASAAIAAAAVHQLVVSWTLTHWEPVAAVVNTPICTLYSYINAYTTCSTRLCWAIYTSIYIYICLDIYIVLPISTLLCAFYAHTLLLSIGHD